MANSIQDWLGDKAETLLGFNQPKIPKEHLHLPGWTASLRSPTATIGCW
jgi:hypothetical protein